MLNWINKDNAVAVPDLRLTRLVVCGRIPDNDSVEEWLSVSEQIDSQLERFITYKPRQFWSTLVHTRTMVHMLESCLDFYIKTAYFNESDCYVSSTNERVKDAFLRIYMRVLMAYLRIMANLEGEGIIEGIFGHIIYSNKIITIDVLVKLCGVYGADNKQVLSVLMQKIFSIQPGFKKDLETFFSSTNNFLERCRKSIANIVADAESNTSETTQTTELIKLLDNCSNVFLSLAAFIDVFQPSQQQKSVSVNIAIFVDHLANTLTDLNIVNLSTNTEMSIGTCANILAKKRSRVLQTALHLYKTIYYSSSMDGQHRFRMIYDNLNRKEFIIRLDDTINIENELSICQQNGVCTKDHVRTTMREVNEAYASKANKIKTDLMRKQILQAIGNPKDRQIDQTLQSLEDLLQDYSRQQLHLCLRHYDYDLEKATNALMEKQDMPFELRVLLRQKSQLADVERNSVHIFAFSDADHITEPSTSEKQKMSAKASAISFDLTPMSVKPVVEEVSKDAEQSDAKKRARLSELLKKYEGTFDMTGVRTAIDSLEKAKNGAATDLIELDGKVMVKRDVNRRQLNDPDMSQEEKAALREKYKRYCYEMSDEDDEDGRYDLDARLAEAVGQSGRFNKPREQQAQVAIAKASVEDDEYDDTYDDCLENFSADIAASNYYESSERENRSAGQKAELNTHESSHERSNGPPSAAVRQNQQHRGNNPMIFHNRGSSNRGRGTPANANREQRQGNTSQQQGSSRQGKAPSNTTTGGPSSSGYTGGRARQTKERHKGKMQQRGADRKARGGMF
ncbi:activating signal cointegrator 1 complex subunit 2 [Ditylenchus destructor]|uniref:Activating signal cointegrator 1 complex subunit 2 n=1 Tax=Ditylenchus destructor TaxID=166010 RepID=A0AAD4RAV3_9BILA|nr:activating signal cointegrator 1 complex subunit 2 [Ditylenchus destructor]